MIDELLYEEGEPEENNRKPDMNSVVMTSLKLNQNHLHNRQTQ